MYRSVTPAVRCPASSAGYWKEPSAAKDRSAISSGMSRSPAGRGRASSSSSWTRWNPASPCQTFGPVKPMRWSWYQRVAARCSIGYVYVRCPEAVS